jgi:hypothetical protein
MAIADSINGGSAIYLWNGLSDLGIGQELRYVEKDAASGSGTVGQVGAAQFKAGEVSKSMKRVVLQTGAFRSWLFLSVV